MAKIKEGFKGERLLALPESLLVEYSKDPLIGNLYVRKIGMFPKVKFHYVQKPEGCDYAMLIYCTDGRGWCEILGKRYEIEKNSFIFLPPHVPYSFGADEKDPWTIYWLHFRGHLSTLFMPKTRGPLPLQPGEHSRLQVRFRLFEEIYTAFSKGYIKEYMIYSSMCLYLFLSSFIYLEQYRHIVSQKQPQTFSTRVIYYMQENVQQKMNLEQISSFFKYSPSHFSMLFMNETGISPINYFLRLKIQRACQDLELSSMKISEVAYNLGFEEPAYFSRLFTKIMGISPSQYRQKES